MHYECLVKIKIKQKKKYFQKIIFKYNKVFLLYYYTPVWI